MTGSLYLHIPFCRRKCTYCDFVSYEASPVSPSRYVQLLQRELADVARRFPLAGVPTVYFGGGTPSLLSPPLVGDLLDTCGACFPIEVDAEVTLEVNPGTVTPASLAGYRQAGVNRLSIGIQSLDQRELELLGRIHSASQGRSTVRDARRAGFDNVSVDLMHSLPGQTLARWKETLEQAIALEPEHISAYGLTLEEGTPLTERLARGEIASPDPELAADMLELTIDLLVSAGYGQYEISNFALPGRRSRHNQVYWRRGTYLGIGAGAHSFVAEPGYGLRWENPADLQKYAADVPYSLFDRLLQPLSRDDAMAEFFFLGLRLCEGIDLALFADSFGVTAGEAFPGVIERHCADGLLVREGEKLRFSRRGMMLANRVLADFV
jgi:oxygen-independent coproporphyrinogen-3 oxidase